MMQGPGLRLADRRRHARRIVYAGIYRGDAAKATQPPDPATALALRFCQTLGPIELQKQ